jgi:hypothetical protein
MFQDLGFRKTTNVQAELSNGCSTASFCEQHSNSGVTGCRRQTTRSGPLPHRCTEGLLRFEQHGLSLANQNVGIGVIVLVGEVRRTRPLHLILLLIPRCTGTRGYEHHRPQDATRVDHIVSPGDLQSVAHLMANQPNGVSDAVSKQR